MDRNKLIQYLINRAKEKSTWIGLITFLGALGIGISPELAQSIVPAGIAIAGVISVLLPADLKKDK